MFTLKHNECVGFESKWKVKKVFAETTTQTTEFSVSEKGCSTVEQKSQDAQTIPEDTQQADVDMDRLADWLTKIYPTVKKEIDSANNSKVFRNYRLLDDPVDAMCKMMQVLKVASIGDSGDKAKPIVACLDWNHFGKAVAVAQNFKHKSWCHHTGLVFIYLLNRDNTFNETPKKRLSTESCVTTIKYHPSNGAILAAGTFAGQIYIWNTDNDLDPIICNIVGHDEFITQISWTNNIDSARSILLASSSTDGLIKMWNFNIGESILQIKCVYKIKTPLFGKINHTVQAPKSVIDRGDVGIVGFDFSKYFPDMFVVATEGGLVARCSMLGATKLNKYSEDVPFYDPIFKYYEPHKGEIVTIRFAYSQKDMFLTSATDGEIRIYLIDQDDPAQVIFTESPMNDVMFILHEEKLIAACGQRGNLEVFHLIRGKPIELTCDTKVTKRNLTSVAINNVKTDRVVVGNDVGEIQLWHIPWQNIEVQNRK